MRFPRRLDPEDVYSLTVWGLIVYVSTVPFYFLEEQKLTTTTPDLTLGKYLPFALCVGLLIYWIWGLYTGKKSIEYHVTYLLVSGIVLVSLASLLGAGYAWIGLAKWGYYNVTGCCLGVLVMEHCREWRRIRGVVVALALVSSLVVLYVMVVFFWGSDPFWGFVHEEHNPKFSLLRVSGPFGGASATASYIMFLTPLSVWMTMTSKRSQLRLSWGVLSVLHVFAVILTQTRGALIAMTIAGALTVPRIWDFSEARGTGLVHFVSKRMVVAVLGIGLFAGFLMFRSDSHGAWNRTLERWLYLFKNQPVVIADGGEVYTYDSLLEYTERFRIAQYRTVGNVLEQHPVLGVGFGTFTRNFEKFKYTDTYMEKEFPEHTTDNMYLMFLAETGVLGLAMRLFAIGIFLSVIASAYRRCEVLEEKGLLLACLAGLLGLHLNMLTWDILNHPTLRIVYWVVLGLSLGMVRFALSDLRELESIEIYTAET